MCGLVGLMSSNMLQKHKECLASLLYLDTWRGRDSTGVAAIRHNSDTVVMKSTVPGYEFTEGPKLFDHLKLNDFLWIGHNRFGTVGKNVKTNAHPFTVDDKDGGCVVVGAHNGTLKNKDVLIDHHRFGTDSEALYNNIAVEGIETTVEKIEGAWALTYYDHGEEEFRVLRNKERPLFYAWADDKKTLFWASEIWMIRVATTRAEIKLFEDKVYSFSEDTLYSFAAPEKLNDEIVLTSRKGGLVGKTSTFFQGRWTGGQNGSTGNDPKGTPAAQGGSPGKDVTAHGYQVGKVWDKAQRQYVYPHQLTSTTPSGTETANTGEKQLQTSGTGSTKPPFDTSADSTVTPIGDAKKYKGYSGTLLSRTQLRNDLSSGCSWCETEMIDEGDRFAWLAPASPICRKCLDGTPEDLPTSVVSIH